MFLMTLNLNDLDDIDVLDDHELIFLCSIFLFFSFNFFSNPNLIFYILEPKARRFWVRGEDQGSHHYAGGAPGVRRDPGLHGAGGTVMKA